MWKNRFYAVLQVEWGASDALIFVGVECEQRLWQILVPFVALVSFFGGDALQSLN